MQKSNLTTIEGRNSVLEALKSNRNIKKIIIDSSALGEKIETIISLAKNKKIEVSYADRFSLNRMSATQDHEGVIAPASRIDFISFKQFLNQNQNIKDLSVVVLRGLIHDQNFGAIIRTACASGIQAIGLTKEKKGFFINPNVEKVSQGGTNYISFIKESFFSLLKNLDKEGFKIVIVENNATNLYFNEDYTGRVAFIFGNEAETLNKKNIGNYVKIPMSASISSLNVSASAAVIFYERFKQINQNLWKKN